MFPADDTWVVVAAFNEAAVIEGVQRICVLLARHFPASEHGRDELPNRPRLL